MEILRKNLDANFKAASGGVFRATISTDSIDRDGEVLVPQGMDSREFEKNPVVFWNHDYDKPIAKSIGKLSRGEHGIDASTEFAVRPADFKGEFFPDVARALVEQGIVKGVSVGFMPIESRPAGKGDRAKYGDGIKRVISKWKLFEYSLAPLPANQDALITALGKGIISELQVKSLFGLDLHAPDRSRGKSKVFIVVPGERRIVKARRAVDVAGLVAKGIARATGQLYI